METIRSYVNLTKARIVVLFALTGWVAIAMEGSMAGDPVKLALVLIAMMFTAASANSLNMYVDQDIDAIMDRTRFKRSLPLGKLKPKNAIVFGLTLGITAFLLLYFQANTLTALISVFTIAFYVLIYTKWLKRTTHHNTVIGGVAGATAPLMGWAAATAEISPVAWSLFAIIFVWSAPHFWALAITLKDDYAKAGIPMLPVKFGEARTRREILIYTIALIPVTFAPWYFGGTGNFYAYAMIFNNAFYLGSTLLMMKYKTHRACKNLFWVSLIYLTLLFAFLIGDLAIAL